jgi:hypothetical protein
MPRPVQLVGRGELNRKGGFEKIVGNFVDRKLNCDPINFDRPCLVPAREQNVYKLILTGERRP